MIGRLWRGLATGENALSYAQHLRQTTLPALREIDGYRGAYVLRRENGEDVEFVVLTIWESLEAVRRFAGENYEIAVVPPEAQKLLTSFDERATHYEVALDESPSRHRLV